MLVLSSWFFLTIVYSMLYFYIYNDLFCKEKFIISKKIIVFSIITAIINTIFMKMNAIYLKPIVLQISLFMGILFTYKQGYSKTIMGIVFIYFVMAISEVVFSILTLLIFDVNQNFLKYNFIGIILANLIIFLIYLLLSKNKYVVKISSEIMKWQRKKETLVMILSILFFAVIIIFFLYQNFLDIFSDSYFILNNVFFICVIVFLIIFYREKNENSKLLNDYDRLLEYSRVYEKELTEKSKQQHEYKNQLIMIKSMLKIKEKKASNYIDDLINDTSENPNSKLLEKLSYINSNGLKGLIYYKLKIMNDKNIQTFVDVSKELDNERIWEKCNRNLKDISRCLGVYIDNAIEASSLSSDKNILIEIFIEDDDIIFAISNTYIGNLEIAKFNKEGYSTKGKNRGYGLSLVKDIIDKNQYLDQSREMNGKYYMQKLIIKIK